MKDYVLELASKKEGMNSKINCIREYLQAYILRALFDAGLFRSVAFVGGTALRFLHNLPRYSEDLDFSFEHRSEHYEFGALLKKIKNELMTAGYDIDITYKEEKTVQSAFFKFTGLLFDAGIPSFRNQKLSVKIEIDTNPPKGAHLQTEIVNKFFPISYLSYDISSLFAGKVHALLMRKYTKGRDVFDLGWYLSRWHDITPNLEQLTNALNQTRWHGENPTQDNWRELLCTVVEKIEWKKVMHDVSNFLENPTDVKIFSQENILKLLKRN